MEYSQLWSTMGDWEQPASNGGIYTFHELKLLHFQDERFPIFPKYARTRREFEYDKFSIWAATSSNGIRIIL